VKDAVTFRDRIKWWSVGSGALFMAISSYMRLKWGFNYCEEGAGVWQLIAFATGLVTLCLVILTLPKWQSWVGIAVLLYAFYWLSNNACMLP
jgi:hypothetical protein